MPRGVYSPMMSTVQYNNSAPANSQEQSSDNAIFMRDVMAKEK